MTPQYSPPEQRTEVHRSLQMLTLQHLTSSCWRSMTSCPRRSHIWCCLTPYQNQYARCRHQPSSRWLNLAHSHSLWARSIMHGKTNCLHPPLHPLLQENSTSISRVIRAHPRFLLDHQARQKSCSFKELNR